MGRKTQSPLTPDEPELPDARRSRDIEEQRPEMAQVEETLAGGRLAFAGAPRRLGHRDVDDAQLGDADEQLEQDLESDGPELDPVDRARAGRGRTRRAGRSSAALR